jgi:NADP-dependent 3-hydroxy acid dehydrogenase YdfG
VLTQDVMEDDAAARLSGAALEAVGRIEILLNNAGGSRVLPINAPEERWTEAMTRQLAHALLPQMIEHRWGVSSTSPARASRSTWMPLSPPRTAFTPEQKVCRAKSGSMGLR